MSAEVPCILRPSFIVWWLLNDVEQLLIFSCTAHQKSPPADKPPAPVQSAVKRSSGPQQAFNPDDILKHRLGQRASRKAPVDLPPPPPPPPPQATRDPDWAPKNYIEKGSVRV